MSDAEDQASNVAEDGDGATQASRADRMRARAKGASQRHMSVAVPFRAAVRNRHVASSVLAGGIAYRLFLWFLPFGLILGGALGLMDADSTEDAAEDSGLPAAVVNRSATPRVPPVPTHGGSLQSACRSSSMRDSRERRQCS